MDAIHVPASVWLDGQWFDAAWMVETVDGESGELVITATVAGPGAPRVAALRMDMGLASGLRAGAGFVSGGMDGNGRDGQDGRGAPCYDCRTTTQRVGDLETRMEQAVEQAEETLDILVNDSTAVAVQLARLLELVEALETWQKRVEQTASMPLPGVGQMLDAYDPENDASQVSYWDMKLLGMIERLSERVSLSFGGG